MKRRKLFPIALLALGYSVFAGSFGELAAQQSAPQSQKQTSGDNSDVQSMPGMEDGMPGMDMGHDAPGTKMGQPTGDQQTEHGAMNAMSHMHHQMMGPHMYMTKLRTCLSAGLGQSRRNCQGTARVHREVQGLPRGIG